MDGDKFISTNKNTNQNLFADDDSDNFFLQADGGVARISQPEPIRHLNDYDSNILQEGAYREVSDEVLKFEYKISRAESEIKELEKQIVLAKEIKDIDLVDSLQIKKLQWEHDLKDLMAEYKNISISAKISGGLAGKFKNKLDNTRKTLGFFGEAILSKIPGKLSSIFEIRNSLTKLENINKSVDVCSISLW